MDIQTDEKYMYRCLQLARGGKGNVSPNPMVGSVIVCNDEIIGEGFHRKYGEAHAEVNAIASVKDPSLLKKSTLYVNLEPCSHYGKTPPCAELIIRRNIQRVVIACKDPFREVSGRGIRMLCEAGIEVVTGVLEKEAYELNKVFMTSHTLQRPYVYLKWAQSSDGFIDCERLDTSIPPVVFSTKEMQQKVHKLRSEVDAIMVGTRTALLDNPSLSVRTWSGRSPIRIVLDRELSIPLSSPLMDQSVETLIFTNKEKESLKNIEYITLDYQRSLLPQILPILYKRNITSLLVEGGSCLLNSFLLENYWDEIQVEVASQSLEAGIKSPNKDLFFDYSCKTVIPNIPVRSDKDAHLVLNFRREKML